MDDSARRDCDAGHEDEHSNRHFLHILTRAMANKTGQDLIDEAKQQIKEVTPEQVRDMQARNERAIYLDVREPNEWNLGRIPHAIHLPRGNLETKVEAIIDRGQKVVIYCARGNRSALAALTMKQMGYEDVASMSRGFQGWAEIDGEVEG
jgi:rhodanese-related sulfurtransferase